jgi:hypothetical protein
MSECRLLGMTKAAAFSREAGDLASALESAEQLAGAAPNDRDLANLVETLEREIKKPETR